MQDKSIAQNKLINLTQNLIISSGGQHCLYDFIHSKRNKKIQISCNDDCEVNLFVVGSKIKTNYLLINELSANTKIDINIVCIALKDCDISFDVQSHLQKKEFDCVVNQNIQGILVGENAKISVVPSLLVDNNKIKASHSVNIGQLKEEIIFYLTSRGIKKEDAITLIYKSLFDKLLSNSGNDGKNVYDNIVSILNNNA